MKKIIASSIIVILILLIYFLKLEAIGWYFWHNAQTVNEKHNLHLEDYHVDIDGLAISGLDGASELTFNWNTNTLFTVLNKNDKIVELSLQGEILRVIDVTGEGDMEGIAYIDNNRFIIAGEYMSRLTLISLEEDVIRLDVENFPKIRLGINKNSNHNFEGVSWDDRQKRLLVVKEREPKYIISVKGLVNKTKESILNLDIERLHKYDKMLDWAMRDLSAIHFLSNSGHTLILSDESKLLKEFDENAKPVGAMALWQGFHGLKSSIPQPEGVTVDHDKNIYIISEPNFFYVFKPKKS